MLYRLFFNMYITTVDPEVAHGRALRAIAAMGRSPLAPLVRATLGRRGRPQTTVLNRPVPGIVGLAAGMDKNAEAILGMDALGFGFVEIGTVTPRPQPGNEGMRMWRHTDLRALRNRMGFNSLGAHEARANLKQLRSTRRGRSVVVGVNIGKNKDTPADQASQDYAECARLLARYADFLVINVSSPNTPGLRDLQAVESLRPIIRATREAAREVAGRDVPVIVKISPDISDDDVRHIATLIRDERVDGVAATNTTINHEFGEGGLSGEPLRQRALDVVRMLRAELPVDTIIIGAGGIATIDDATAMLGAGADLLEVYSSFVYEGPALPGRLNRGV